jgi:hypothetical protein
VTIVRSPFVPWGYSAWVPRRRTIVVARHVVLTERLLAHELVHVHQAERTLWPLAYVAQWASTGFSYATMPYEREARVAERDSFYVAWARDLLGRADGSTPVEPRG